MAGKWALPEKALSGHCGEGFDVRDPQGTNLTFESVGHRYQIPEPPRDDAREGQQPKLNYPPPPQFIGPSQVAPHSPREKHLFVVAIWTPLDRGVQQAG